MNRKAQAEIPYLDFKTLCVTVCVKLCYKM